MKYQNQKPDLADQIKTLVQSANSVKTVPHGIKTVNPGEGLQLLSGDGAEIFWDWETAAEYDTRISEGRAAIEQARADLDKAEADLAAGLIRVDESRAILDAFGPRVDAAESTAAKTAKDLTALQGTVGDVQGAVLESDRKAAAAQAVADKASVDAGAAASKATDAQATANQAKTAASTADEAARAAAGLAASKGEVIYQTTAPTGSRAASQNLWIRTTDNVPHTWSGSAWVPRTDQTARDAATAAATAASKADAAQATANQAKADAAAAANSARDAMTKAGQALTSADGKTTITRSVSSASQPGTAVGDTHFTMSSMGGGGVVTRQQRWDGSTWQDESLSHQVLASLDLGKATVGELDGIRIKANTVTATQLLVGLGDNYVPDPFFQAPAAWTFPLWVDPKSDGYRSKGVLAIPAGTTQRGAYMVNRGNLPASRRVRFSVWVSSPTALQEGHIRIFMRVYKADNTWVFGVPTFVDNTQVIAANTWGRVTGEFQAPEDGATFMVGLFAQAAATNTVRFSEMQVVGLTEGALIVQGSITGSQIDGESVTAKVVQSMTAEHKNLVVTESAILQHTTLLGTTVADQLNVRKLLRGRDAILTGTVDVAQLNVTEAMSAEIVNAMSVAAKKLVVTEDAILNRATVVQSLVTPELITQKANVGVLAANMISTGALVAQDSTGSVQINSGGITAQDATPSGTFTRQVKLTPAGLTGGTRTTQTVRIDGVNNYMVGEFSTAPDKQRVRIRSTSSVAAVDLFASNSTRDHVGIWYDSPDSNVLNAVGRVIAMTGVQHTDDSPGMLMWPMRGTFGFQGRWQQDSVATKFVVLTNFAGLGPGAYNQITISYQSSFHTNNSLRCPFVSVESATGADVMATIIEQTASNIKVNIINQSGGKASGTIVLRIVTFNINA